MKEIESKIYVIRGQNVMLDSDLAVLYGVETRVLNQAVKRNIKRFPLDFLFQLTKEEHENLISQIVISSSKWGGHRKQPIAFTENGVAMLSGVLSSDRAISVNIAIMRIFTRLRSFTLLETDLTHKMDSLEKNTNAMFRIVFERLDDLDDEVEKLDKKLPTHSKDRQKIGIKRED